MSICQSFSVIRVVSSVFRGIIITKKKNIVVKFSLNMPFYAVARGRTPGIFLTWSDCEAQVKGFSGARYKKFDTAVNAQEFITTEGSLAAKASSVHPKPVRKTALDKAQPSTKPNNLKRSYSTKTNKVSNGDPSTSKRRSNPKSKPQSRTADNDEYSDGNASGISDDLDTVLMKQMDDIEKRLSNGEPSTSKQSSKSKSKPQRRTADNNEYSDGNSSGISDDLDTVLMKQMDDIEKRLKGVEKGVDKIVKKNSVKVPKKAILLEAPQPKHRKSQIEFDIDDEGFVHVFTDGACSSNGKKGARAGLGVYWADGHPLNTSQPVSGRATNNCGEIQAATWAMRQAIHNGITKLSINTDSQFLINSVTKWIPGWKRKGWKLATGEPVKNEIDFKDLDSLQNKLQIKWNYVEAHRGVHGNEMADVMAKEGALKYKVQ